MNIIVIAFAFLVEKQRRVCFGLQFRSDSVIKLGDYQSLDIRVKRHLDQAFEDEFDGFVILLHAFVVHLTLNEFGEYGDRACHHVSQRAAWPLVGSFCCRRSGFFTFGTRS